MRLIESTEVIMSTEIRLWDVQGDRPIPVPQQKIVLESRLEDWIVQDVSLISNDLLVIGRQVSTEYGGIIDILAVDYEGNLVIIELKRDKTPRDVTAQVLDYASCIDDFDIEKIIEIAKNYLGKTPLADAFKEKFQTEYPEVLNERCRMYIVAAHIDNTSERIVKYLSERYGVDINVVTFSFFQTQSGEILGRSMLLDESQVENRSKSRSKRPAPKSWGELEALADKAGVLEVYKNALSELRPMFDSANRTQSNVSLVGYMGENKSRQGLISIFPGASSPETGLAVGLRFTQLLEYFGITEEDLRTAIGDPDSDAKTRIDPLIFSGSYWLPAYNIDKTKLQRFITLLRNALENT